MSLNIEQQKNLLESLLANNNLSKSEVRVYYFCFRVEKNSKEIGDYLKWASPNVARLLLTMSNKGLLNRFLDDKAYIYTSNEESTLIKNK